MTTSPNTIEDGRKKMELHPSFMSGLKGIWLFTWRNQVGSSKFIWGLIGLLALPALIYITTGAMNDGNLEIRTSRGPWGRSNPFTYWLITVYFFMVVPLSCVRMCGSVIRDELEADTLGFLTTRPISRARLVVMKYLSHVAWLQIWLLVQTFLIFGAGVLRDVPNLAGIFPLFLSVQFLAIFAWSGLGLLLGQFSKRYMGLAMIYGAIVEMGLGRIPTNINTVSMIHHLKSLLSYNESLQILFDTSTPALLIPLGAVMLAAVIFLSLACAMFVFREYHAAAEMQK